MTLPPYPQNLPRAISPVKHIGRKFNLLKCAFGIRQSSFGTTGSLLKMSGFTAQRHRGLIARATKASKR
jgi:hypothetical protein